MTEREIQERLYWKFVGPSLLLLPNYTPKGWFECDLWVVTKGGYFREYEIKLTVADFRADGKKRRRWYEHGRGQTQSKHFSLARGDVRGPKQFWFVVPDGLVTPDDVPEWAGLLYVKPPRVWQAKKAPARHGEKVAATIISHAGLSCYYRMWRERLRYRPMCRRCCRVVENGRRTEQA